MGPRLGPKCDLDVGVRSAADGEQPCVDIARGIDVMSGRVARGVLGSVVLASPLADVAGEVDDASVAEHEDVERTGAGWARAEACRAAVEEP